MKNKSLSFFLLAAFSFCGLLLNNPQTHAEQFSQNNQTLIGQNISAIQATIGDFTLATHQSRSDTPLTTNTGTVNRQQLLDNLAASRSARESSNFAPTSRKWTAQDFYDQTGWSNSRIDDHLRGIDFSKPVDIVNLNSGSELIQFQLPGGSTGNYFALPGTSPNTLGIYTSGLIENNYILRNNTSFLRSTASSPIDDWSMKNWLIQTQGGGIQFFSPSGATKVISK